MLGGRWVPGVHQRAAVDLTRTPTHLVWTVGQAPFDHGFGLRVRADMSTPMVDPTPSICATCVDPTLGLSPDHQGRLESASMAPDGRNVRAVHVEELQSAFFDSFATATPTTAYLMEHLGVRWSPSTPPMEVRAAVRA